MNHTLVAMNELYMTNDKVAFSQGKVSTSLGREASRSTLDSAPFEACSGVSGPLR